MKMTFAALAKTLNKAFGTSPSSSSVASGSGSRQLSKAISTPPTEDSSHTGESGKEEEDTEESEVTKVTEVGSEKSDQPTLKSDVEETDVRQKETTPETQTVDGAEDMDIASSRSSSPALVIASTGLTSNPTIDEGPQTSPRSAGGNESVRVADASTDPLGVTLQVGRSAQSNWEEISEPALNRKSEPYLLWSLSYVVSLPSVSVSDADLDQAKVLVLDLLGWGVSPEYLIERGISHALVYTVFTDLQLRLPDKIMEDCNRLVSTHSC